MVSTKFIALFETQPKTVVATFYSNDDHLRQQLSLVDLCRLVLSKGLSIHVGICVKETGFISYEFLSTESTLPANT